MILLRFPTFIRAGPSTQAFKLRYKRKFSMTRQFSILADHPIVGKLKNHPRDKVAIRHVISGNSYTYGQLSDDIYKWHNILQSKLPSSGNGSRIAIMGENSYQFAVLFFATLMLPKTLAMPLCTNHTSAEIKYQLENSESSTIITPERFVDKVEEFVSPERKLIVFEEFDGNDVEASTSTSESTVSSPSTSDSSTPSGYMLYTSGTSGNPKGVVTPLETYVAQADALTKAWDINSNTAMLQTLPLHHVHGLVIGMTLPLLAGGSVDFLFPFSPKVFVDRITDASLPPINTYTAVPTIYTKLVSYVKQFQSDKEQFEKINSGLHNLHLAMCGSAALPSPLRNDWNKIVGDKVPLLERYGMTETSITLSQPLDPQYRVDGSVGAPVPSVIARLVDPDTSKVIYQSNEKSSHDTEASGELQLAGPVVFKEYWNKPEATSETFTEDGWFRTGDICRADASGNIFILGRASMDIIKSGGEKLSALEIEREILSLEEVDECSVVGVASEEWGQEVAVVAVLSEKGRASNFDLARLKSALKKTLANYKIPKKLLVVESIPRNQMGKVNKKTLVKIFD
ncbi:Pcs60p [Sugiyamaella lignohabitans]|uniref:Pcs60p n=1 Tax=Sugiyamaella lignohabitans TaxID=796027 RepID=A0A167CK64_9ASCO|nr:Pcs60p [Sugiyamaella lignohabitans]ANB11802.1 Pcs60p [Sugiyamaella lignohabitans]